MDSSFVNHQQATLLRQYKTMEYFSLVSFSILYWDYLLTFAMEWDRSWKTASISWASVLYFLNRYITLLGQIPVIALYFFDLSEMRFVLHVICAAGNHSIMFTQAFVAALLVMRTYALCEGSRRVLFALLALVAVGGSVGLWAIITTPVSNDISSFLFPGCDTSLTPAQSNRLASAWGAMLLLDTAIFGLTFVKAVQHGRAWQGSTLRIMVRDGTLYFGVLVVVNIANIVSFIIFPPALKGLTTTLTNVLSSTLVSRLMLNLRDPSISRMPGMSASASVNPRQTGTHAGTLVFAHPDRSDGSADTPDGE